MTDSITREIVLEAPVARVWRALSDHREFGTWFRCALDGPFVEGALVRGHSTHPGYETVPYVMRVTRVEPERRLAFDWPAFTPEDGPLEHEPWTHVEMRLAAEGEGTRVTIVETGYDALSPAVRERARLCNEGGWGAQAGALAAHLSAGVPAGAG